MRSSAGCLCVRFIKHSGCRVSALKLRLLFVHLSHPPPTLAAAPLAPPTSLVNVTRTAAPPPADSRASEPRRLKEQAATGFGRQVSAWRSPVAKKKAT